MLQSLAGSVSDANHLTSERDLTEPRKRPRLIYALPTSTEQTLDLSKVDLGKDNHFDAEPDALIETFAVVGSAIPKLL